MKSTTTVPCEVQSLIEAVCDGMADDTQVRDLESLLLTDEETCKFYVYLLDLDAKLQRLVGSRQEGDAALKEFIAAGQTPSVSSAPSSFLPTTLQSTVGYFSSGWPVAYLVATMILSIGMLIGAFTYVSCPDESVVSKQERGERREEREERIAGHDSSLSTIHYPLSTASNPQSPIPNPSVVGRITGMVDCRWEKGSGVRGQRSEEVVSGQWSVAGKQERGERREEREERIAGHDSSLSTLHSPLSTTSSHQPLATGDLVSLGDTFALRSGLLELTYDTGARVILQGPVTYEVESAAGGYLSLGRLTARLEKKVASGQWPVAGKQERGERREEREEKIAGHDSSLSTIHYPLSAASNPQSLIPNPEFAVRTPTALITDLGTEFGVAVDEQGHTASYVYRGVVRLRLLGANTGKECESITLHEKESARTKHGAGDAPVIIRHAGVDPHDFVQRLVQIPKTLDLLDIVAGGDGRGQRRECGIDASTGMEDRMFLPQYRETRQGFQPWYKTITWNRLIDGVFVPDGRIGAVKINSGGSRFVGFPKTDGKTYGSIWARAAKFKTNGREGSRNSWIYAVDPGGLSMPDHCGLLGLHANSGITFNLEAMRTMYQGTRPARFRATVAVPDAHGLFPKKPNVEQLVDIWVFVDDQLKLQRPHFCPRDGAIAVDIKLGPKDKFLTLASTDGGDGTSLDWVVFGDPVLEIVPVEGE